MSKMKQMPSWDASLAEGTRTYSPTTSRIPHDPVVARDPTGGPAIRRSAVAAARAAGAISDNPYALTTPSRDRTPGLLQRGVYLHAHSADPRHAPKTGGEWLGDGDDPRLPQQPAGDHGQTEG